jgi:hypothetical protein
MASATAVIVRLAEQWTQPDLVAAANAGTPSRA